MLLTSAPAGDDAAHPPELWGPPQSAAWCAPHPPNKRRTRLAARRAQYSHAPPQLTRQRVPPRRLDVVLNALWGEMLSGVLQRAAPARLQEVLDVYLEARDVVPIPDFVTHARVISLDVGKRCPFGIRAIRVNKPQPGAAADADLVLDVDIEVMSSDADVIIHAMVNDLVAPLLAKVGLRKEDASFIAMHITSSPSATTGASRLAAAAFREAPVVALGLDVAYHSKLGFEKRVPVTALPGVVPMLEILVRTEVAEYAVWPRFFAVDLAPPLLLGIPCAPGRGPAARLGVRVKAVRGLHVPVLLDKLGAPKPALPFALLRWSTGLHHRRTAPAAAPLDATGATSWDGDGACVSGDAFAPFGLEFLSVEIRAPSFGRLGAAQVKAQALTSGETLYSYAGAEADAFGPLPHTVIADTADAYQARTGALLPGRASARGVSCSGERNAMEAWLPLDGQPGAAVLLRVEMDWLRRGDSDGDGFEDAAGLAALPTGGMLSAVALARSAAALAEHSLVVAVVAARGLPPRGDWAVAVGRPGEWRTAQRTRVARGTAPDFDDAFELRSTAEAPVVTLLRVRGIATPGPALQPLAAATLPSTQLRAGDAAAMWLTLEPLPGAQLAGPVEVLLRCTLTPKM